MNSTGPFRAVEAHTPTSAEIQPYLSLVYDIVARYSRRLPASVQHGDLIAAGTAGVFDALRKSSDRGPSFESYVRTRIRGAVIDELRAQDWLSRGERTRLAAWTDGDVPCGSVVRFEDLSPDARASFADGMASPIDDLARRRDHAMLASAVASLPPRERVVVTLHYLQEIQLTAIAAELGVSVARASQLRARGIDTLRCALAGDALERASAAGLSRRASPRRSSLRKRAPMQAPRLNRPAAAS